MRFFQSRSSRALEETRVSMIWHFPGKALEDCGATCDYGEIGGTQSGGILHEQPIRGSASCRHYAGRQNAPTDTGACHR